MNGPIAQLAALACHANARLARIGSPGFFPSNSTCQFCDSIDFRETDPAAADSQAEQILAPTPDAWLDALPGRGIIGVRIASNTRDDPAISDRLSAGFVGGGRGWHMQLGRLDETTEIWTSRWHVWNQDAPERRIWRVSYCLDATRPSTLRIGRTPPVVKAAFRESLEEARTFSERHTQGVFTGNFAWALKALDDPAADIGYHKDIALPGQLGPDAAALLKASMRAWVFGGMGSWNDMAFEQPIQTEYENISDRLFDIVHEAIEVAVNSSEP